MDAPTKEEFEDPTCDKCGAPITTGMMAVICPYREKCEFWPEEPDSQAFVEELRKQPA